MADGDGFSQQDPSDSATPYNRDTFVMRQLIAQISTAKIVKVLAVNPTSPGRGTVDVQPTVNQIDGQDNATPHGKIFGVPYCSWQYGKNAVLADPVAGDMGVMICADRDISAVKATKDIGPPGSSRQYDAADGVYLGGLLTTEDPEQYVKFTDTGIQLHDKNSNDITTSDAGINWSDTKGNALVSNDAGISINGVVFDRTGQVAGNLPVTGNFQLGGSFEGIGGGVYASGISISGTLNAADMQIPGHVLYSLHEHAYLVPVTSSGGGQTGTPS